MFQVVFRDRTGASDESTFDCHHRGNPIAMVDAVPPRSVTAHTVATEIDAFGVDRDVLLDEVVPGTGNLDYGIYLRELSKLDDVPLMMKHMKYDEYPVAAENIRRIGRDNGIEI